MTTAEPLPILPLRIGPHAFFPPVLPAPMCGISDYAWRLLGREQGCPVVATQMVSSEAMIRGAEKCWRLLDMDRAEEPIIVQLFGADPATLARCARMVADAGATIVDLNMGCPADKIVRSKGGSALMREPDLVRRIFAAIRAELHDVPFTVKFRAGWDKYGEEALTIARIAEQEGLDALCIHGRTREQKFKGQADWSILAAVKQAVSLPVIGNGDIRCADDAERMMRETGVDGVMVGRAAMGNPWVFGEISARLAGRPAPAPPTLDERLDTVARHAAIMVERKGPYGLVEFRKHLVQYMRGFPSARQVKKRLLDLTDPDEFQRLLGPARAELLACAEQDAADEVRPHEELPAEADRCAG
ncbi:MAG: tRNA dihydrouridine synthase DusB [Candidatus Sumerlaeia bacterium]|nr:tRNA dihydrouridine synthase DusB [Candidatus Sumerlaeia bacterium]